MKSARRGQVLIISAFAMVVLLGVTALVIDLGFAWMLRRAEQNAVDPAAVAAARYLSPLDTAERDRAACFYVQRHGFFTDDPDCLNALASGDLYVGDPISGPYSGSGYVEVRISAQHVTFFGRILGLPSITVATSAVAANGGSNVNANSLVALDPTSCGAGMISGNGVVDVGGYVYLNSICGIEPPYGIDNEQCDNDGGDEIDPHGAMQINGSQATLITPHLYVRGTCDKTSNSWNGPTTEGAGEIEDTLAGLLEPDHSTMTERGGRTFCPPPATLLSPGMGCVFEGNSGYPVRLDPGVYYGGWVIRGQARIELNPGIYYIAGGGIQMSGNPSNSLEAVDGTDIGRILIFSTGDPDYTEACVQDPDYPAPPPVSWTQYARPDGDAGSDGDWTGTFVDISEETADDATLLVSPADPTDDNHYDVTLSGVDTPADLSGVVVRYRYSKTGDDAGQPIDLTVELREGTNVIASETHTAIEGVDGSGWQDGSFTLTTTEAGAVTDWWGLSLRFDPSSTDPPEGRQSQISWAEVEVPPGSGALAARRCQGKIELVGGNSFKAWPTDIAPWAGLLMWQDGTLEGNGNGNNPVARVDLGGQGTMNIAGTIYGPQAECSLRGNSAGDPADNTASVQMICWRFHIVGNGGLNMPYDPDQLFGNPQKGLVH